MSLAFKTEQEKFWAGEFGTQYSERNQSAAIVASNAALFAKVFEATDGVRSVIEFGANVGLNLRAIRELRPDVELAAIEINASAAAELRRWNQCEVIEGSFLDFTPSRSWDLVLCKGVLIHTSPDSLSAVYQALVATASRYVLVAEYYNPTPVTVPYRGHTDKLFKRDFAGEILDQYPEMKLAAYGFCYHRDANCPQDDLTWFLLEKAAGR